jgi:hypothetical protein
VGVPAVGVNELDAYKDGRADERGRVQRDNLAVDRVAIDAYDRGLRDERHRHRGSPVLALITFILVCIALAVIVLAVKTGSFSNAGAAIDNLVRPPVQAAADRTGTALENAGKKIKNDAGSSQP